MPILPQRFKLPQIVTGHRSDLWRSFWLVVPIARTNLCRNPSFETGTTNWAALATAVIAQSTTADTAYVGNASLGVQFPASGDGARYGGTTALSLTSGTAYGVSCWVKAATTQIGIKARICIANTSDTVLAASTPIVLDGTWQRLVMVYSETSTTSRRLIVQRQDSLGSKSGTTYVDAVQVEAISDLTQGVSTYLDGDQQGLIANQQPPPYGWDGTPHNSTSYRLATTRAGGYLLRLDRLGFTLLSLVGLGMGPVGLITTPHGQLDGSEYQRTNKTDRLLRFIGRFDARTPDQLDRLRARFYGAVDRDAAPVDQPMVILYQKIDDAGLLRSDLYRVIGSYTGGLEGAYESEWAEAAAPEFTLTTPAIASDAEIAAALTVQASVSNVDYIFERSTAGVWAEPGSGANNTVTVLLYAPSGLLYAAGVFTSIGGTAANDIANWDGSAWTAMGTGLNAQAEAMVFNPSGNLIVAGQFTSAGGVANTTKIALWNTSTLAWSAIGTGLAGGEAFAVAIALNGDIYVTGTFTTAGGGGATRIAKWNGSAWSALTTGLSGGGLALAVGLDGAIYVAGNFATAGGVTVNNVAKWDPVAGAWSALSTGTNGQVETLVVGLNGLLYAAGQFTTAGGVAATRAAVWNGSSWQAMGSGFDNTVQQLLLLADGRVAAVGSFTTANGIAVPSGYAIWNGSSWTSGDLATTTVLLSLAAATNGRVAAAPGAATLTITSPGLTTVTNNGSAWTYPIVTIKGPSSGTARIYELRNLTTGSAVYLNYTINVGETAVFDFTPDAISFSSDFQGNLMRYVLPGSSEAAFFLQHGANVIGLFSASSTVTASIRWRTRYNGIAQTTR